MTDTGKPYRGRATAKQAGAAARNESALLVNPLDSKHIVGVEEITLPGGTAAISARVSFDGGASWRESWPLRAEPARAGMVGPVLAIDARGTLNLAAMALDPDRDRACLVVYQSEDGGIHWTLPKVVLEGAGDCSYSIAADLNTSSPFRGHVYLAADMGNTLSFARSQDGERWNGCGYLKPGPLITGLCFNPEALVDLGGALHIVWTTGPTGGSIRMLSSANGGETFGDPLTIAEGITGAEEGLPETAPATCITRDGVALCVWADDREGRARIYGRRSLDGGRTWRGPSSGEPLIQDSQPDQHEFQPHLIVTPRGEIVCAFYEYGPKPPGGSLLVNLVMAVSYDRGATFKGRMVLSERPWDPSVDRPLSRAATRGALSWLSMG